MQFLDTCRCCLEKDETKTLFPLETAFDKGTIIELIEEITNLKILIHPSLPATICKTCLASFLQADSIKSKFIESEDILRALVESPENQVKTEVLENEDATGDDPLAGTFVEFIKIEENLNNIKETADQEESKDNLTSRPEETTVRNPKETKVPGKFKRKQKLVDPRNEYQCESCKMILAYKTQYEAHLRLHKKNDDPPLDTCSTCEKKFYTTLGITKHRCIYKRICHYCGQHFQEMKMVYSHMDEVHRSADGKFICNFENCNYSLRSSFNMFNHLASHFDPLQLICEYCSRVFSNQRLFRNHKIWHKKRNSGLTYTCDLCGHCAKSKQNLPRHFRLMHQEKRIQQSKLGRKIRENFSVDEIEKYKHWILDGKCKECSYRFVSFYSFRRHVRVVHMKIREHECPHEGCGALFSQKGAMLIHHRKHTNEKPYKCQQCEFRCADPSTLNKHAKKCR